MSLVEDLRARVEALFDTTSLEAVVQDGWPAAMVEAGFALHRKTWNVDAIAASLAGELHELESQPRTPASIGHVWPALPGAGVSPMLHAALLGVDTQSIRSSRRSQHFAARVASILGFALMEELRDERIVVSGSDETVGHFIEQYGADRVVGYGHRLSFAVVVDDGAAERHAASLANDVVMWFGQGCFSARAVLFVGDIDAGRQFGSALAEAIAERELALCSEPNDAMLAQRMQGLGLAEFETEVWKARIGWVELRNRWAGEDRPANVVTLCPCEDPRQVLDVDAAHRQGLAWCGPGGADAASWGVTRVCAPGELQAPPPDWRHDGVSNAAALLGLRSGRIGF